MMFIRRWFSLLYLFPLTPALAGDFLGISTGTVTGDAGVLGMNQACQATFGPDTILCSSKDILSSPALSVQTGNGWVHPVIVAMAPRSSTNGGPLNSTTGIDYSGFEGINASSLSCSGWSQAVGLGGLTVSGNTFSFARLACDTANRVACCQASSCIRISPR